MKYRLEVLKMNQAMIRQGFTRAALAEKVGVSPACITHWCKSTYKPSPKHILKLANALHLSVEELVHLEQAD
ncbi:helix-turn-helix transcriptional regulator [Leeia oryzae]|uniref:helix-turn-helix transcriptional regulator n=1 Tax=Leeia oryzae TaxID=356662 RepID=UPI0003694CB5